MTSKLSAVQAATTSTSTGDAAAEGEPSAAAEAEVAEAVTGAPAVASMEGDEAGDDSDEELVSRTAEADAAEVEEAFAEDEDEEDELVPSGPQLVGRRVRVWWLGDGDDVFYDGEVKSFSRTRGHAVRYDVDEEVKYHNLDDEDDSEDADVRASPRARP